MVSGRLGGFGGELGWGVLGQFSGGDLWTCGSAMTAEARKRLRTSCTSVSCTASIQAYFGAVTLGSAVAIFATAIAPNVAAGDGGVTMLSSLVTGVWLAFIFYSKLQRTYVQGCWYVRSEEHSYVADVVFHLWVAVVVTRTCSQDCPINA